MTASSPQRYVLGDWGTSRARLFLIDNEEIVDRREGAGIVTSTSSPADALAELISPWLDATSSMDVVLSGMIGSRNGLFEVPYARVPADRAAWSRAASHRRIGDMNITIAAGLQDACDVMRGEETQVFGAMRLDAALGAGSHVFVLPGTHSKWVEVENGAVVRLRTALTGEVYALLRDHSTLLKAGHAENDTDADANAGFAAGAERAIHLADGLLSALFEARTAQLIENRSRGWASGFLSGLLIGYEVATLGAALRSSSTVKLIGDPTLVSLYRRVFAERGIEIRELDGAVCVIAGLKCLRECASREHA